MKKDHIMNEDHKPRWIYRFDNYKRALLLLRQAIEILEERGLNDLEKEGVIQRFEYTWELAWKVLKDYLNHAGIVLDKFTPASVIRAAFEAQVITNGDLWMQALDARNKMSHVYDAKKFEDVIQQIHDHYLQIFDDLYMSLLEESLQSEDI
ncbi:MAG: nucleotidyltransferase substrate binding protein [Flavobacteriales bacterium]|nr:nucleotidyltransferase substrate binding protein [Flavobacteriales bacterium]